MGWLQLVSLAHFSLVLCTAATAYREAPRNVTADELLEYAVVVAPGNLTRSQHQPISEQPREERADCHADPSPGFRTGSSIRCTTTGPGLLRIRYSGVTDSLDPGTADASVSEGPPRSAPLLPDSDFVFASGTCMKRMRLAGVSRSWRGAAVRAFFLTDSQQALPLLNERGAPAAEVYGFFPSEGAPELGGVIRSLRAGDTRAAVAPFAAHRHFGETYKWMLYGDDDTVFFLDAVKELVASLDPELPIALADNLWYLDRHPNPNAPRCLPCHMTNETLPTLEEIFTSADGRVDMRASYQRRGIVRTFSPQEYLDWATNTTQVPGERYMPDAACPYCTREAACAPLGRSGSTAPCKASVAHGGAGMIFSVGLMRSIAYRDALECFLSITNSSGSDHMVSECLWRAGYAFTDPGGLVRHKYSYQFVYFGGAPRLPGLLGLSPPDSQVSQCDETCRWMLRNVVSMHMMARLKKNWKVLAQVQAEAPRARQAVLARLGLRPGQGEGRDLEPHQGGADGAAGAAAEGLQPGAESS